jgi:uncharacterized protein (UPF0147 family)
MATSKTPARKTSTRTKQVIALTLPAKASRDALKVALDGKQSTKARIKAAADIAGMLVGKESFKSVLDLVTDAELPSKLRFAALEAIQAAVFNVQEFEAHRATYLARLRKLREDPDPEMRTRVMGILAREQDAGTQELLVKGLENPTEALIPPEKALQLLGNDIHAGLYGIARRIADDPPNALARREALRILASTSESAGYFEGILRDKAEPTPIRQLAAGSLNQLAPQRLQAAARDMALDEAEDIDVKSLSLTALTNFGNIEQLQHDSALQTHVEHLKESPAYEGTPLQAAVESFKRRCGT